MPVIQPLPNPAKQAGDEFLDTLSLFAQVFGEARRKQKDKQDEKASGLVAKLEAAPEEEQVEILRNQFFNLDEKARKRQFGEEGVTRIESALTNPTASDEAGVTTPDQQVFRKGDTLDTRSATADTVTREEGALTAGIGTKRAEILLAKEQAEFKQKGLDLQRDRNKRVVDMARAGDAPRVIDLQSGEMRTLSPAELRVIDQGSDAELDELLSRTDDFNPKMRDLGELIDVAGELGIDEESARVLLARQMFLDPDRMNEIKIKTGDKQLDLMQEQIQIARLQQPLLRQQQLMNAAELEAARLLVEQGGTAALKPEQRVRIAEDRDAVVSGFVSRYVDLTGVTARALDERGIPSKGDPKTRTVKPKSKGLMSAAVMAAIANPLDPANQRTVAQLKLPLPKQPDEFGSPEYAELMLDALDRHMGQEITTLTGVAPIVDGRPGTAPVFRREVLKAHIADTHKRIKTYEEVLGGFAALPDNPTGRSNPAPKVATGKSEDDLTADQIKLQEHMKAAQEVGDLEGISNRILELEALYQQLVSEGATPVPEQTP